MLACDFGEVRDITVVRIVDGRRVSVHRSDLVELFGLITCVETGRGQVAKQTPRCSCGSALDPRFWVGHSSGRMWTGT